MTTASAKTMPRSLMARTTGNFRRCNICGSDNSKIVTAPHQFVPEALTALTAPVSTTNSNTSISLTTCGLLEASGRRGFISSNSCIQLQSSPSLPEICACQQDPLLIEELQPLIDLTTASLNLPQQQQTSPPQPQQEQQQTPGDAFFTEPSQVSTSPPPVPLTPRHPVCHVCGTTTSVEPNVVTRPKGIVTIPSGSFSCAALELGGILGQIETNLCSKLPDLTRETCGCRDVSIATSFLEAPHESCSICGNRRGVSLPNHVLQFPHYGTLTCAQLQQDGFDGHFSLPVCEALANSTGETCGCSLLHDPFHNTTNACHNICGPNNVMGNPNGILNLPNHVPISCQELQNGGRQGRFSSQTCLLLPNQIRESCNCHSFFDSTSNSSSAVVAATPPNTTTTTSNNHDVCHVCGEAKRMTIDQATVFIPRFNNGNGVSCAALRGAGLAGQLPSGLCTSLPDRIQNTCGCIPASATTTTTTTSGGGPSTSHITSPPTVTSVAPPPSPTVQPTPAPVIVPDTTSNSLQDNKKIDEETDTLINTSLFIGVGFLLVFIALMCVIALATQQHRAAREEKKKQNEDRGGSFAHSSSTASHDSEII